jgi:hypothetical protein
MSFFKDFNWIFAGILLVIFSTVFGQFFRFEIGSGGILFSDIFIPLLALFWAVSRMYSENFSGLLARIKKFPLFWESFLVITIFSASLFFSAENLAFQEFAESGFYLFRYTFLLVFALLVFDELSTGKTPEKKQHIFLLSLFIAGIFLAILGFLQLKFYPDFKEMAELGWDPHKGRLLSTWFDPNYLGGLFSFLLVLLAGIFSFYAPKNLQAFSERIITLKKEEIIFWLVTGVFFLSLIFTFSRSALLTFAIPAFFLGIFYFRKIFVLGLIAIFLILPFSERAMERIGDGLNSAISITEENPVFLPDPTARLRVENFNEGTDLAEEYFWTGVGFNTIRFYRTEITHASGGFDSSLLTVFVTTGVFGFMAFLWWYFALVKKVFWRISTENSRVKKGVQRGLIFSVLGIFAQSFFVNFLFFPLFLVYFFGIVGYAFAEKNP